MTAVASSGTATVVVLDLRDSLLVDRRVLIPLILDNLKMVIPLYLLLPALLLEQVEEAEEEVGVEIEDEEEVEGVNGKKPLRPRMFLCLFKDEKVHLCEGFN